VSMSAGRGDQPFYKYVRSADVAIATVVVGIIFLLMVPLPPVILDFLLSLNIAWAVITILMSIYIVNPLEFAVFPTMLLVATLYRLALDVSATRLILLQGHIEGAVGEVIPAFAQVVVGGNLVVGFPVHGNHLRCRAYRPGSRPFYLGRHARKTDGH